MSRPLIPSRPRDLHRETQASLSPHLKRSNQQPASYSMGADGGATPYQYPGLGSEPEQVHSLHTAADYLAPRWSHMKSSHHHSPPPPCCFTGRPLTTSTRCNGEQMMMLCSVGQMACSQVSGAVNISYTNG